MHKAEMLREVFAQVKECRFILLLDAISLANRDRGSECDDQYTAGGKHDPTMVSEIRQADEESIHQLILPLSDPAIAPFASWVGLRAPKTALPIGVF
jgi:hypothetical protein